MSVSNDRSLCISLNAKLHRFVSLQRNKDAYAVDAMHFPRHNPSGATSSPVRSVSDANTDCAQVANQDLVLPFFWTSLWSPQFLSCQTHSLLP